MRFVRLLRHMVPAGAFALAVSFASALPAADANKETRPMKIVTFGDSTTAPRGKLKTYSDCLREELPAKGLAVEVVNAGIGGNTTRMALARFQSDVLDRQPDLVVIQFGINDSAIDVWRDPPATGPRVPQEEYVQNLEKMVEALQARQCRVILMTPNPIRWTERLRIVYGKPPYKPEDPDGFNLLLRNYAQEVRRIAAERKAPLVDVYAAHEAYGAVKGQNADDLLLDGMHPNDKGQRLVADLLMAEIVKMVAGKGPG